LGARAIYLGDTQYRIHGTNDPTTIGKKVSSGCVRLTNEDVIDLYGRIGLGAKVIVLSDTAPRLRNEAAARTQDHVSSQSVSPQAQPSAWSNRRASTETGPVATAFGLY